MRIPRTRVLRRFRISAAPGLLPAVVFVSSLLLNVLPAAGQIPVPVELRFMQRPGEVIHADATVNESVFINGIHVHDAVIGESSISRVLEVDEAGVAVLEGLFRTEERITGRPGYVEWLSSETVRYSRDSLGRMTVPPEASRPVLRNLPVFPGEPVVSGSTWTAPVGEVHVFRIGEIFTGPYRSTAPAAYEFAGMVESGGRELGRILLNYNLYLPVDSPGAPLRLLSGRSRQELLWDVSRGRPAVRTEDFEFLMMMADGTVREFRGRQRVDYRYTETLDRLAEVDHLKGELESIPGILVSPDAQGVRLTLRDSEGAVYFDPESSEIRPDQRERLDSLARVLNRYRDRDILITGHTADFGSPRGRYLLSVDRAAAVAGILFPEGNNGSGRLFLRGRGSDEPAGEDAENRRVEILILD